MSTAEPQPPSHPFTFKTIALPLVQRGIPVIPVQPYEKRCILSGWQERATTSIAQIEAWDQENPSFNVGCVAKPNGIVVLDCDRKGLMKAIEAETGQKFPDTLIVRSAGKGCAHIYFLQTESSRALGNQRAADLFDLQSVDKYVVGPDSTLQNGSRYRIVTDAPIAPFPDWLAGWIKRNADKKKATPKVRDGHRTHEDFDFDATMDHYDFSFVGVKDDVWHVVDKCPGVDRRHEQSTLTAVYWDGDGLGWSCFASGCPLHGKTIGQVLKFLHEEKGYEPYEGVIWSDPDDLSDSTFDLDENEMENEDDDTEDDTETEDEPEPVTKISPTVEAIAQPTVQPKAFPTPQQVAAYINNELTREQFADIFKGSGEPTEAEPVQSFVQPTAQAAVQPTVEQQDSTSTFGSPEEVAFLNEEALPNLALEDPQKRAGLEFPEECMYGKLKVIAERHPRLQLGWLYPSLLAMASALPIEDGGGNVRSNMYVANLGDVGMGKTACVEAAECSIFLPEFTIMEETPSSDRGLAKMLGDTDGGTPRRLLLSDEFIAVMQKCAIQGSALPQMINKLWSKDKAGASDKTGIDPCFATLSILGNVKCSDPAEFAKVFGASTVSGMADRFLYGIAFNHVKYRPPVRKLEVIDVKPVTVPGWVWDAKDNWAEGKSERRRLTEHVLRVALVTAAVNGDREIMQKCFECALRFIEWQERIRQIYRPGLAETKEAECFEAVVAALQEQLDRQVCERKGPKGADEITSNPEEQIKLLRFTSIMNKKSYYRKYSGLMSRVLKTLVEAGLVEEVKVEDERGKKQKTPFVRVRRRVH